MPEGGARTTDDELDDLLARAVAASEAVDPASLVAVGPPIAPLPSEGEPEPARTTRDELRRLTIMFSDLVGSTPISAQLDPETYRGVLHAYKTTCQHVIEAEFEGHLVHTRGDGILAVFGYPTAHEDDALRAVKAALEIHRRLVEVSAETRRRSGAEVGARIGVHRGLVYVEHDTEELYGFAVNVAARVQEAAAPGTVAISEEVRRLVDGHVSTAPLEAGEMKGVEHAPALHIALDEQPRAPRTARLWPTPLFGRADALAALRERLDDSRASDRPVASVVIGDAGVGKTRLVGAFLDELPSGTRVLELGGSPFHQRQGLHPVRELLRARAAMPLDQPPAVQLAALRAHLRSVGLEHLVALLAPVAGLGPEAGYEVVEADPRRLEALIADAVHELLTSWLEGGPGLVLVEDLHWLDPSTTAALTRLVAEGPAGLLVVATSRDDRSLGAASRPLCLDPLEPEDCLALIRCHDADIPDVVATEVLGRSDGIPLFVEELVRSRHEQGDLDPGVDVSGDGSVPSALYEPLYARLNTLTDARVVASAAAAIGRTVHLDLLARVSGVTTSELDQALTALMEQRVLEPDQSDGRSVRFRHELVRLVAYELEPPSGRQRFHQLAAQALQAGDVTVGADWSLIAEHHRRAAQPMSAALALEHAADDARRRGSLDEARGQFDHALAVLQDAAPGPARDRLEIQLRLHRAFLAVSSEGFGSEHAAADYQRCLQLCVEQPASAEMYQTLIAVWGYYINRSDLERAWSASTALRALSQGGRASMLPTNEAGFGMIEWYRGATSESVRRLGDAVAAIEQVGVDDTSVPPAWTMPLDPLASMHIHYALSLCWAGRLREGRDQIERANERCSALAFPMGPFTLGYVGLIEATISTQLGDLERARARAVEVVELAQRHGFDAWLFWASIVGGALEGLLDPATDRVARAAEASMSIEMWHAIGARVHTGSMRVLAARLFHEAGDRDGTMTAAKAALAVADETGSVAAVPDALALLALAGPSDHAEATLVDALDRAEQSGSALSALRIATELVRYGGSGHRHRLEAALAAVDDDGVDAPVVAEARSLLVSL